MKEPLLLLAFDTSVSVGSVALGRGTDVLAERTLPHGREHAMRLVPAIQEVIEAAGVERDAVQGVVVGRGPGSFTGVRIAAATARGLARGLGRGDGRPLWAWSSLAAAAASGEDPLDEGPFSRPRAVLFDARGDRVYAGVYRFDPEGMETILPPRASTLGEILTLDIPDDALYCGDGAERHRERLEQAGRIVVGWEGEDPDHPPGLGLPSARGLLRVHALHPGSASLTPQDRWEPDYLRSSSAARPVVRR